MRDPCASSRCPRVSVGWSMRSEWWQANATTPRQEVGVRVHERPQDGTVPWLRASRGARADPGGVRRLLAQLEHRRGPHARQPAEHPCDAPPRHHRAPRRPCRHRHHARPPRPRPSGALPRGRPVAVLSRRPGRDGPRGAGVRASQHRLHRPALPTATPASSSSIRPVGRCRRSPLTPPRTSSGRCPRCR